MVLIILALVFVAFRYFNPGATDNFVDTITNFPSKVFNKDKSVSSSGSSLLITGTTLTIRTWDFSNEEVVSWNVIVEKIEKRDEDSDDDELEDILWNLLASDNSIEESEDLDTNSEFIEEENVNISNLMDSVEGDIENNDEKEIVEEVVDKEDEEDLVVEIEDEEEIIEVEIKEDVVISKPIVEKEVIPVVVTKTIVEQKILVGDIQTNQDLADTKNLIDSLIK